MKIQRQDRSSMVMKLTPGGIVVYIPRWLKEDSPQVQEFITGALEKLKAHELPTLPPEQTSATEMRALVKKWAAVIGVQPKRITLRTMYRKWGSCSSRDNINLNRTLCHVPKHLAEYVVLHELVHLRIFNHGKEFKAMMSEYMPDWKEREKELKALRYI